MTDEKILERYLKRIDLEPNILCNRLDLKNCIELKNNKQQDAFYLARNYLSQRAVACWEDIVRIFCEMNERKLAKEVANKQDINYQKYCHA